MYEMQRFNNKDARLVEIEMTSLGLLLDQQHDLTAKVIKLLRLSKDLGEIDMSYINDDAMLYKLMKYVDKHSFDAISETYYKNEAMIKREVFNA